MTSPPAAALRAAMEARIVNEARARGVEPGLIRRRLVFQRLVRRLPMGDSWVIKGGFLLETRLPGRARMTKDLDLASSHARALGTLRDELGRALDTDPDGDHLVFSITGISPLRADASGAPGSRVSVDVMLAGRVFDRVRVDVVARVGELAGAVETLVVGPPVAGLSLGVASVRVAVVAQHAAEKLHAIGRTYAGLRPSTRVKDLIDVVLLAEAGLLPDPRLGERLRTVFDARDGTAPPDNLPEPPASWVDQYTAMATEVGVVTTDLTSATALAREIYRNALT